MIEAILKALRNYLNEQLRFNLDFEHDVVFIQSPASNESLHKVSLSLLHVEKENYVGNPIINKSLATQSSLRMSSSWLVNIYVLVRFKFSGQDFLSAIKVLDDVLYTIQGDPIIEVSSPNRACYLGLINSNLSELSNLRGILRNEG
ncbi:hypothetical protein [Sphingobacterium sp. MYb382]|uniref:hypothetical protein n=1 Tax=Sphingobacterium sp. MYb382 TaxID=2745278 RepID=UPI00309E9567